jgi:hypothetical protein
MAWAWRKIGDPLWQFMGNREYPPLSPPSGYEQQPLYVRCPEDRTVELERQVAGYQHHLRACEQIAGQALGYPWFKDDQVNFPGSTEEAGVCIGDHVGDTIVEELAEAYAKRGELINRPEVDDFVKGAVLEAAHQVERHGVEHDAGKAPLDWFWLIGYLVQKAATAAMAGDAEKAKHHTISTAAALANWHAALSGRDSGMRPGIEPPDSKSLAAGGLTTPSADVISSLRNDAEALQRR